MSKERWIVHIDMDAFYAAVEQRDNPEYRGKPVIIGGRPGERGVVSTASYEARKFGVRSAMSMTEAVRRCPQGIYLRGDHRKYGLVSQQILAIYCQYTPLVEPLALDEAFLDVSGCLKLFGSAEKIGQEIKARIQAEIGITASVGIGPNKYLAKLASDIQKPNGFVVINREDVPKVLNPLPLSRLWGAGARTVATLNSLGIQTIGDMLKLPLLYLEAKLGVLGHQLYYLARGIDDRPVEPDRGVKSVGHETTFLEDVLGREILEETLLELTQWVGRRLRKQGLESKTITIKVRDHNFETITRSFSLQDYTDLDDEIFKVGKTLLQENYNGGKTRLIGISVSNLVPKGEAKQLSLFTADKDKREKISNALDSIKDRFGEKSVTRARLIRKSCLDGKEE